MSAFAFWVLLSSLTVALLLFTAVLGRRAERIAAAVYVVAWIATVLSHRYWPDARPIAGVVVADLVLLLTFVGLAWRSPHPWPAFAAGVQLIVLALHLAWVQELDVGRRAFVAAQNMSTLAVLAIMAWGAWRARRTAAT